MFGKTTNNIIGDKSVQVCVSLPAELLEQVDKIAWRDFCKRSDVVRLSLVEYLRAHSDAGKPTRLPAAVAEKAAEAEEASKLVTASTAAMTPEPAAPTALTGPAPASTKDEERPLVRAGYDANGQWHDYELEWALKGMTD